ncbi:MAG: glutathione-disulfide reductase [Burkholderiales bacterium]|nr:glutathione-disulfide reductase [Burkholderiales bacterium]
MIDNNYDLIIIGGGSGGISIAREATKLGKKVCIIEQSLIGGTCVNLGCIPKKIMWLASMVFNNCINASKYGIQINSYELNWTDLITSRQEYINGIHEHYCSQFQELGIMIINGSAKFFGNDSIKVNNQIYHGKDIVIATGSKPNIPNIIGKELGITSDDFFNLDKQPKDLIIVGGGYIGVELACILNYLGCKVTLVIRKDVILSSFDKETSLKLQENMERNNILIYKNTEVSSLNKDGEYIKVHLKGESQAIHASVVLWAVGRDPNLENLDLEKAKVSIDNKGFIKIDEYQKTSNANIYAVGDVTDRAALTPVAVKAGNYLARYLSKKEKFPFKLDNVPSVIFAHPPFASVGINEEQARQQGKSIEVYKNEFMSIGAKLEKSQIKSFIKLIVCKETGQVLGCHILGNGADEAIQGFSIAIDLGLTMDELKKSVPIHPTFAEELVLI